MRRVVALMLAAFLAGCGGIDGVRAEGGKELELADPIAAQGTAERTISVYLLRYGKRVTVERTVSGTPSPEQAALQSLLTGPTPVEVKERYVTAIPAGAKLLDFALNNGAVEIDLGGPFETIQRNASTDDIEARQRQKLLEQIVYTLTEFDTVRSVEVRVNGATIPLLNNQFGGPALTRDVFDQPAVAAWHDQTRCTGNEKVGGRKSTRALRVAKPVVGAGVVSFAGETDAERGAIRVQLEQDGTLLRSLEEGATYNRPADGGTEPCAQFEGRVEIPWGVTGEVLLRVSVQPVDAGAERQPVELPLDIGNEADLAT